MFSYWDKAPYVNVIRSLNKDQMNTYNMKSVQKVMLSFIYTCLVIGVKFFIGMNSVNRTRLK